MRIETDKRAKDDVIGALGIGNRNAGHRSCGSDGFGDLEYAIAECPAGCVGQFTSRTTNRHHVAAVGKHVEFDHFVAQVQEPDRVGAQFRIETEFDEPDDAAVIVTHAQFLGGTDHAVGRVAVGLPRSNCESAGKYRAGQGHDDLVAFEEVAGTADDAVHRATDINLTPANRLAVALRLLDEFEHAANHDRADDVCADRLDGFGFDADAHIRVCNVIQCGCRRDIDEVGQP